MPHDKNNQPLAVGDRVTIPALVKEVQQSEEFCNVSLETEEPMSPGTHRTSIVLNAKQVLKVVGVALVMALFTTGCLTSRHAVVTGNQGNFTTNWVTAVNTNNLIIDSAMVQVATAIAVTAAINGSHNDAGVIGAMKNAQVALGGILNGTNPQTTGQIVELLKAQGNPVLADQVNGLVAALSAAEQALLVKYGTGVAGQISVALTRAVYSGLTVGLAGH